MATKKFKGVIFDLDGVITGTAKVHGSAWKDMFDDFLKARAEAEGGTFVPFDRDKDYLEFVDGKPRLEGIKSFLASRGIEIPMGEDGDSADKETVVGLGNRKNTKFQEIVRRDGPDVFESTVRFIKTLKKNRIHVGVASSSKNCKLILELAGLLQLFETRVDGEVSAEIGLKGKPNPDIFVVAAKNMGLVPHECVVVEDAISGVEAGRNGNFGLVLGIARNQPRHVLKKHGADIVVGDMAEINVEEINDWFENSIEKEGWTLSYDHFSPEEEKLRETLTAVGNGYLGTRGAFVGESAGDFHYPGTYLAGIYNKLATKIHDKDIWNNDFVNCPNWLPIEFKIGGDAFVSPLSMDLLSYKHELDMKAGVTRRNIVCKDKLGRMTLIETERLVSMANPHLCALKYDLTPLNYEGKITVRSYLDGDLINDGVPRYRQLKSRHLYPVEQGKTTGGVFLSVKTKRSKYNVVYEQKTRLAENNRVFKASKKIFESKAKIGEEYTFAVKSYQTYSIEKTVGMFTSLDAKDPRKSARTLVAKAPVYNKVFTEHAKAWDKLWQKADLLVDGDRFSQKALRLHAFHILCTASPHNVGLDVGMPARGLNGEAYRGHVFWDEVYIFPFYNYHAPEVTKALLMYRYNRLDGARKYAKENGYEGAMFPWQTCDGGEEETQEVHYNPKSGTWGPDLSRRQRHVSIAVFYNTWRYINETGDTKFLEDYGAELMLDISRFWASIATKDSSTGKYHIAGVMGPDEFHEKLPNSSEAGIRDNAYTNIMVVWLLEKTLEMLDELSESSHAKLAKKTGFKTSETTKWQEMLGQLNVNISSEKIIEQFDGYFGLKDLDWDAYRKKYDNIHRMDRILKAEGDNPDNYKVAKQADSLMAFYLLPPEEIAHILEKLGHKVGDPIEFLKKNYEYYESRTSHGSTLSKVVHAVISSHMDDPETTWDWFSDVLKSDIYDTQGGTTPEGIHTGVMAGSLDIVHRYFAGIDSSRSELSIDPNIPAHWQRLNFRLVHRGIWYDFDFLQDKLELKVMGRGKKKVAVMFRGKKSNLTPGQVKRFRL
jgi:beta-phosphoglucomutase family hydrolase